LGSILGLLKIMPNRKANAEQQQQIKYGELVVLG